MAQPVFPPVPQAVPRLRETAGIQAARILDSCGDRDCLEDLQVFFPAREQEIVNSGAAVSARYAEAVRADSKIEPQSFRPGYYNVDITYYFLIHFSVSLTAGAPAEVAGHAYHQKRYTLFGGESGIKTFISSDTGKGAAAAPVSVVQVSDPVALSAVITERAPAYSEAPDNIPAQAAGYFADIGLPTPDTVKKTVLATIGLFSVVSLTRDSALLMPVYDYALPERYCPSTRADPGEIFNRIGFPFERFYPENINRRR